MAVLDTRQVVGQGLTAGAGTGRLGIGRFAGRIGGGLLRQPGFSGRDVAGEGFLEQVASRGGQGFTFDTKSHSPQVGQFEDEGLNLGLGGMQFGIAASELPSGFGGVLLRLIDELLHRVDHPFREFRRGFEAGQFCVQIHARMVADNR